MTHGVLAGVRSYLMFLRENFWAKTTRSLRDCSVVSHLKTSGLVSTEMGTFPGVEFPSGVLSVLLSPY